MQGLSLSLHQHSSVRHRFVSSLGHPLKFSHFFKFVDHFWKCCAIKFWPRIALSFLLICVSTNAVVCLCFTCWELHFEKTYWLCVPRKFALLIFSWLASWSFAEYNRHRPPSNWSPLPWNSETEFDTVCVWFFRQFYTFGLLYIQMDYTFRIFPISALSAAELCKMLRWNWSGICFSRCSWFNISIAELSYSYVYLFFSFFSYFLTLYSDWFMLRC